MVSLRIFEDTAVPAMGHCQSLQLKESHDGLGGGFPTQRGHEGKVCFATLVPPSLRGSDPTLLRQ